MASFDETVTSFDASVSAGERIRTWRRYLEAAAVRYRNPHVARHTYATRLRRRGVSMKDISLNLGHANTGITDAIYVHVQTNEIRDRMRTLGLAV